MGANPLALSPLNQIIMKIFSTLSLAVSLSVTSACLAAHTSQEALEALERRYGAEKFTDIVSITGTDGVPSPSEWWIVVRDPRMPSTLHTYWSGDRRVTDEGENRDYYPRRMPDGFVNRGKLQIDSTQAFVVVEQEAAKMQIGFNEVSYELKAITLTDEPVWNLTLIDARGYFVGIVSVSGRTGNVLRKVWMTPGTSRGGFQMGVSDSIAPGEVTTRIPDVPSEGATQLPLNPTERLIPTEPSREGDIQDIVPVPLPEEVSTTLPPLPEVAQPIRPEEVQEPTRQTPDVQPQPITPEPEPQRPSTNDDLYEEITPENDGSVPGP